MQEDSRSRASYRRPRFNKLNEEQIEEVKEKLRERNDHITNKINESHKRSILFILLSAAGAFFLFMYSRS